jgi:hypothetical protein
MRPLLFLLLLAPLAEARPLRVVATTTLVADIARQVAGSAAEVESLVPFDADPHAFQPAPRDMARLAAADMVLLNGLGLEAPFATLLSNVPTGRVVDASRTIRARRMADEDEEGGSCTPRGLPARRARSACLVRPHARAGVGTGDCGGTRHARCGECDRLPRQGDGGAPAVGGARYVGAGGTRSDSPGPAQAGDRPCGLRVFRGSDTDLRSRGRCCPASARRASLLPANWRR